MNDVRWSDQAAAYALGALDPEQTAAFEARLAEDPELRRQVADFEAALAGLGETLPGAGPPAKLKQRVLARARQARLPARSAIDRPPRRTPVLAWTLLAASVAGLAWVGIENLTLRDEVGELTAELGEVRSALAGSRANLARLDSLSLLLSGSDVRFATLTGDAQPTLRLVWSAERRLMLVAASNLAPPDEGRTYQLWGIRGDEAPVSLGTFVPDPDGNALVTLAPDVAADFDLSALTDEPAGGSPQPTTQPFLVGEWRDA